MKIIKILYGNDGGGVFECEKQFLRKWQSMGIEVFGVIVGNGEAQSTYSNMIDHCYYLPELNLKSTGIPIFKDLKNILESRLYSTKVEQLIFNFNLNEYDAIICRRHYLLPIAIKINRLNRAKVFWQMPQAVRNSLERLFFISLLKKHSIIPIGNSNYTMKSLGDCCSYFVYPGFNKDRTATKSTSQKYRDLLSIPKNNIVFGIAARINKRKAQKIVLEAFVELLKKRTDINLIIAGGPLDSNYALKCQQLTQHHSNNIHFLGQITDLPEFYASIDVYINSRIDAEPFGISVGEAMGSGLPIIAYKMGGPSEMIDVGLNGWLVDQPNKKAYMDAINKTIQARHKIKEMGLHSFSKSEDFTSELNSVKMIDILKRHK